MHTLLIIAAGYLLLGGSSSRPSGSGSSNQNAASPAPAPQQKSTGTDLAAAFGAFVGSLIDEATDD